MEPGSAKRSGSHYDLLRPSSAPRRHGWTAQGLAQLLFAVVALFLVPSILYAYVTFNASEDSDSGSEDYKPDISPTSNLASATTKVPQLNPTYENVDGTEYIWQIPIHPQPNGILFLAHGCQCKATFFWDKHDSCEKCTGMPEERTVTLQALARGYAVIAVSSTGECWNSKQDTEKVLAVLRRWIFEKKMEELPVFGLGASSGGYFISELATHFTFKSLVIQISSGRFEAMDFDSSYPPTLFVHMPKDKTLAKRIDEAMELLKSKGILTGEVLCPELQVTRHYFSERIPDLSPEVSEKIVATLEHHGVISRVQKGLYMKRDGRRSGWKLALRSSSFLPLDDRLKWERPLEEEMNLAYALHEFTSLPAEQMFKWFQTSVTYIA